MEHVIAEPIKRRESYNIVEALSNLPTVATMFIWVMGLWVWGTILTITPNTVDMLIIAGTAVPAILFFWRSPEYGILALMFYGSGFLSPQFVDVRLPIGGGLEMRDILLLVMFGITFFQRLTRAKLTIPWWPVGGLLAAFLGVVFLSLFNALIFQGVAVNWALSDARILFFYLIFFIVAWGIESEKALYAVLIGSFMITDITALIIIIQQFLGGSTLVLDSMRDGSWALTFEGGVIRVVPPGIVYMYFMLLLSLGLMIFYRVSRVMTIFWIFHTGFLSIGLVFTYTRSSWVASAIAIALLAVIIFPIYKPYLGRLIVLGLAGLLFLGGLLGFLMGDSEGGNESPIVRRFTSIFESDTVESNSLQWRVFEMQEVLKAVAEYPLTGVGLGNKYRTITPFQGEAEGLWADEILTVEKYDRFTRYAHSSYLAVTVKVGIPGILLLMGACIFAILKSCTLYFKLPIGMAKGITITMGTGIFGLLYWSIMHAQLMLASSTIVVALVMGLMASIHTIYVNDAPKTQPEQPATE